LGNFGWALAYALAVGGDSRCRIGLGSCVGLDHRGCLGLDHRGCLGLDHRRCLGLDHRGCLGLDHRGCLGLDHRRGWVDGRCLGRRLGKRGSPPCTLATASGLLSASFLALNGGPVALTGIPVPPAPRGSLASRAAVTSLGPRGQKPAFTTFKQTAMAARVPTAKAVGLTQHQRAGKLDKAHGRDCSRAVRRREGDTSRRYLAPTTWTPLAQDAAAYTCQITCSTSHLPGMRGSGEGQNRDRRIAEWLNWLCENGSVPSRC
jgi:hypothetical protein